MPIPKSVKRLLEAQKVPYGTADTPLEAHEHLFQYRRHLQNLGAARTTIVEDGSGQLQVLTPADCLLDLNALNQFTQRQLQAATDQDLCHLYERHQMEAIPALPKVTGLTTIVDERLLEPEALYLESGGRDQLLTLSQSQFRRVLRDAEVGNFTIPINDLRPYQPDDGNDIEFINQAVANFTQLRINQRLEETLEFPPLPETAQRIIKLRVDPEADINDLAEVVETDASLAAQVVSWAASPYYSAPGKIRSVHDAIVRVLGFDLVLNLALGLALGKTLSPPKDNPKGVTSYWEQSVYCAATMEGLVTAINKEHRPGYGMAYLSGLLHNFGYLLMAEIFPPHFATSCRYIEANPHVGRPIIEGHLLGITQEQISSSLMRLWNMPEEVCVALRHQHNPDYDGEFSVYANLVYTANRLLRHNGIGDAPLEEIPASLYERLHLDPEKAQLVIENIMQSADDLSNISAELGG